MGCHILAGNQNAIVFWLNHHLGGDHLAVERHGMHICVEGSVSGLGDGAPVKNDVLEVAERTVAASSLNVCIAQGEHFTTLAIISSYAI